MLYFGRSAVERVWFILMLDAIVTAALFFFPFYNSWNG